MKLDFFVKSFFYTNFELQSTFDMSENNPVESLNEIKSMMQRISKFTSIQVLVFEKSVF